MPYQFVQRAVDPDLPQMVGLGGLEPPTLPLSGVRSNHLSYRPIPICRDIGLPGRVSTRRVRYMPGRASRRCRRRAFPGPQKARARDPGLSSWCRSRWWSQSGSNRRPPACKAGALPAELWPRRGRRTRRPRYRPGGGADHSVLFLDRRCLVWAPDRAGPSGFSKGGDPAAPSDTATLLRLHPSH